MKDKMRKRSAWQRILLIFALATAMLFGGCAETISDDRENAAINTKVPELTAPAFSLLSIPAYSGEPYTVVNNNNPYFADSELTASSFEKYSELDSWGRCGAAYASVGTDLMPTEKRGSIGQVKPSGWHTVKYDVVDGNYLYNRCHLIGYQLTGENANAKNLITGTRYLNVDGMLPFENMVADYVKETDNHVQYRVTPIFEGTNALASGVLMEAKSVEDDGEGICFNVYVYNVQPGVTINYGNGDSWLTKSSSNDPSTNNNDTGSNAANGNDISSSSGGAFQADYLLTKAQNTAIVKRQFSLDEYFR